MPPERESRDGATARGDRPTTDDETTPAEPAAGGSAVADLLGDVLAYSREREYTGWDYSDGMSSRLLQGLPVENRWVNLAFQETAKRAPVNVRPLLLVEQRRNFMGAGLFALANLTADRLSLDDRDGVDYGAEAVELLEWLFANRCRGYAGFCGSHQHRTQSLRSTGETDTPSILSTAFPARAMLRAADRDPVYGAVARTAGDFLVEDLDYREVPGGAAIDYHPEKPGDYLTPNAMAVGAGLLLDLYAHAGDRRQADRAGEILSLLADLQSDAGGWPYRVPPDASHLSMDNFHNGYVVETFLRYADLVDDRRFADTLDRALSFYRGTLFEPDGAPNWDEADAFPRDVHASAQAVIVFARAGEFGRARRVLAWALEHLYAGDGRFYYRKHRLYTRRITLMRWCQAWMAYALSVLLARRRLDDPPP